MDHTRLFTCRSSHPYMFATSEPYIVVPSVDISALVIHTVRIGSTGLPQAIRTPCLIREMFRTGDPYPTDCLPMIRTTDPYSLDRHCARIVGTVSDVSGKKLPLHRIFVTVRHTHVMAWGKC